MNKSFYFSHDYNARNDEKIIRLIRQKGYEGYGLYWAIIEDLYTNDNQLTYNIDDLSYHYRVDENLLESVLTEYGLFVIDGTTIYSLSITKRLEEREKKSKDGKKGASGYWNKVKEVTEDSTNGIPKGSPSSIPKGSPSDIKERKGKDIKEIKDKKQIDSFSSDFEETWSLYGKVGSKKSAYKVWEKLDENKKALIVASIPGYKKHLTKTGYAQKHFSTYLNSDEYENYLNISTSTGGEIKATEITIMPCLENNFDFSLARKLQGVKSREEYYQVITDNREEASKVYNCLYSFSEEEISAYKRLERRHPFNLFTELYYDYCHAQN